MTGLQFLVELVLSFRNTEDNQVNNKLIAPVNRIEWRVV